MTYNPSSPASQPDFMRPTVNPSITQFVDVELAVFPSVGDGTLLEAATDGVISSILIDPTSSARVIDNPETIIAITGSAAVGPLLAVTDQIGQTQIGALSVTRSESDRAVASDRRVPLPLQPLRKYLGPRRSDTALVERVADSIDLAPLVVSTLTSIDLSTPEFSERVLDDSSAVVSEWLKAHYQGELAKLRTEIRRGAPWSALGKQAIQELGAEGPTQRGLSVIAAVKVERLKRERLLAIGMERLGHPPLDMLAQAHLPEARLVVQEIPEAELQSALAGRLGQSNALYKRATLGTVASQREELAWALAQEETRQSIMSAAREGITSQELSRFSTTQTIASKQTRGEAPVDVDFSVLNSFGRVAPYTTFFPEKGGMSLLSLEEWALLPTRPVIIPGNRPLSRSPHDLAEWIFGEILYSPQVCDRRGSAVGLSGAKWSELIGKVEVAIQNGEPISASQYMPMVAIGNPIKRNTQTPALAELDVLRRLAEVSHAVELQYPPGMKWLIGNEAPAFQGPEFDMPGSTVSLFHEGCEKMARLIDPDGNRLYIFDEAEYLWGNDTRRSQWEAFEKAKYAELKTIYDDVEHPRHDEVTKYINTYIYPMATCVDPYKCEYARSMSVRQIGEVYASIKQMTGSVIRGVGSLDINSDSSVELTSDQQSLLRWLLATSLHRTFMYRVAMESRDVLPSFRELILPHTVPYTMVTKREKPVIFPNSGKGAYFPAHGEAVLVPQREDKQRTVVTVRPWWQIASQSNRYEPKFLDGRNEPFYFQEIAV